MNAPRRSNTLMGTFEKNALAVWWDEVVLFVSLYTIVFFVNLWFALVAWASSGWTRWFAGLLFWAEAWCPAWPVELRCGLALGCAVPLAWLCYLWTARAVCGRTLSLFVAQRGSSLHTDGAPRAGMAYARSVHHTADAVPSLPRRRGRCGVHAGALAVR
jgi:hypothetical protein